MKKLLLFIALIAFSFSVYAQKAEEIKPTELPKNVTGWISQNFKGYTTTRAVRITENKVVAGYCAVVASEGRKLILVFDKNGKFLEKVRKMTEVQNVLKPATPAPTQKK